MPVDPAASRGGECVWLTVVVAQRRGEEGPLSVVPD